jgi:transposase InsO family protein
MVEMRTERNLKVLRTDNGMKFCSGDFNSFCRKEGIVRHHSIPYTPQQNGVAADTSCGGTTRIIPA